MKKLLIATDNFEPRRDGITRFLTQVIPSLRKYFDVMVLCPNYGKLVKKPFKMWRIPLSKKIIGDYVLPKLDKKTIKEAVAEADIVWVQSLGVIGYHALTYGRKFNKKTAAFINSIEWELLPRALNNSFLKVLIGSIAKIFAKRNYRKVDLLLSPSQGVIDIFEWNHIYTMNKVVQLGVDAKTFRPSSAKRKAKKKAGIGSENFVIGYHGRLSHEKDLKTLLRAFARIRNEFPTAVLLIVGEGLKTLKDIMHRQRNVLVAGRQDEVVPWLQAMDVYCHTSLTETTCLSVLEAMSCGLPVIATSVGYIKDYITEGKNGFLIRKQDSYALYSKLKFLMNHREIMTKVGKAARETVVKQFKWEKTTKQLIRALQEL